MIRCVIFEKIYIFKYLETPLPTTPRRKAHRALLQREALKTTTHQRKLKIQLQLSHLAVVLDSKKRKASQLLWRDGICGGDR